jgi:hypothetical protein
MPAPDNTHEGRGLLSDTRTLTTLAVLAAVFAVIGALIAYFAGR